MTHPAMDTDALRRVAEAHHVAGAAMHRLADAIKEMGDVTQPAVPELPAEPAAEKEPEPEPVEWRNDRLPKRYETDHQGLVWTWTTRGKALAPVDGVKRDDYWALGHRPAPKSPPPDVVGSQEPEPKPEPEKPRSFFPFMPEELAAICAKHQPEAPPEREESRTGGWIVDRVPEEKDGDCDDDVRVPARFGVGYAWINWKHVHPGSPWSRTGAEPGPWDPTCLDRNGWIRSRLPTVEDANGVGVVLIPMGRFGGTNGITAYDLIVPGQPWAPWGSNPGRFGNEHA